MPDVLAQDTESAFVARDCGYVLQSVVESDFCESTIIRRASLTCEELPGNLTANMPLHRDVDIDVGEQGLNSFFIARSRYDST
jgi:hypothetical protein